MKPKTVTKTFVVCPGCEDEFSVQHLIDARRSPGAWWSCNNRSCRTEILISVSTTGEIDVEHRTREGQRGLALLKLGDLYVVVDECTRVEPDHADYFYHSHQCPENLLRDVVAVFDARGSDPHGVLRFVANIDATPEARDALEGRGSLAELFQLFGTDGQPAPTRWPEENGGMLPFIAQWQRDASNKGNA